MNDQSPSPDDTIAEQAADWVARLHADDATGDNWLGLESWLAEDAAHRAAYDQAEMIWREVGAGRQAILERLDARDVVTNVVELASRRRAHDPRWRRGAMFGIPAAAAAAIAALVLVPMLMAPMTTYTTAPGEHRDVVLGDGTRIAMNGGSTLRVRMTGAQRRVEMDDAEAAFDVTHDPARPFIVAVGESQVRVVGTAFDIARSGGETRVAVARGIVEVRDATGGTPVRLTIGQALSRDDATDQVTLTRMSPASAMAWRDGRLIYDDRPLTEVAADLSRAFRTPFTVAPDARNLRFSGVLELDAEDKVIARLEGFLPVTSARSGQGIELRRR